MNRVLQDQVAGHRLGVQNVFSMISKQGKLTHEQRLELKRGGRPCPELNVKNVTSKEKYERYPWICGDKEKNTFYCWPCLVMGDLSKVSKATYLYFFFAVPKVLQHVYRGFSTSGFRY